MRKQFTNREILSYAESLSQIFLNPEKDIELPIKTNFYLQKNIKAFTKAAQEIDESRLAIGEKYGEYNFDENCYEIRDKDQRLLAQQDLKNLLSLDQVLEIYTVSLDDLQDTQLTVAQLNAMLFMIEEN